MQTRSVLGVLAAVASASVSLADTLTLVPSEDNTLYEDALGTLSNGSGSYLFAGATNRSTLRRGLVAFDLSSIPAGSTITGAQFTLYVSRSISGAVPTSLHAAAADWGEGASIAPSEEGTGGPAQPGDATWTHRFSPTEFWTTPGGDYVDAPSSTIDVGVAGLFYTWGAGGDLNADVQRWLDSPATNFGWVVICSEGTVGSAKRFASSEHPDPTLRPVLVVDFVPPGPPCDPDVNCDGVPDQDDVACIILAVAGDMGCFCQTDPDFNGDGVPDQGDVASVILTVAGAPCE